MIIFHSTESFLLASFLLPKTRGNRERMAAKICHYKRPGKALPFPINAIQSQGPTLSAKVSVVRFDSEDSTTSGYNHTVSSSVF